MQVYYSYRPFNGSMQGGKIEVAELSQNDSSILKMIENVTDYDVSKFNEYDIRTINNTLIISKGYSDLLIYAK